MSTDDELAAKLAELKRFADNMNEDAAIATINDLSDTVRTAAGRALARLSRKNREMRTVLKDVLHEWEHTGSLTRQTLGNIREALE